MENKINQPKIGMLLGKSPSEMKENELSLVVNGNIQSVSGGLISIVNEQSNLLCNRFKGYKVIGIQPVISLSLTFYFLVNPTTNQSEIGFIYDQHNQDGKDRQVDCPDCNHSLIPDTPLELTKQREKCKYFTFVNADCLKFSIDYPIQSWVKVDDCNIRLYFVQGNNSPRYVDYLDYQKVTLLNCPKIESNSLDCDKIKIFKDACPPEIEIIDIVSGGINKAGKYQFTIAYSDAYSNPVTTYFAKTNGVDVWDASKTITIPTDYEVNKSIKLRITNINPEFDWFNLVVLKTINNVTTPYLIETFSNTGSTFEYVYSGVDKNVTRPLTMDEVLKAPIVYDNAELIEESNGYLILGNLTEPKILNLQPVINKLNVLWETVELKEGDYANPILAEKYQSSLRDEVVPLAIEFNIHNTTRTARFHIPGRAATPYDLQSVKSILVDGVYIDNPDVFNPSLCDDEAPHLRWQVYNTGSNLGYACNTTVSDSYDNIITGFFTCKKELFYQDSQTKIYYKDYNATTSTLSNPITPCTYFTSSPSTSCLASIHANYPSLISITDSCDDCKIEILTLGGSSQVPHYDFNGIAADPGVYPNPSGNISNIDCDHVVSLAQYPCSNDISTSYLSKLPNTGTILWFKTIASATAIVINLSSAYNMYNGSSFKVTLYKPDLTQVSLCTAPIQIGQKISSNSYVYFDIDSTTSLPLTLGVTYFITIEAVTNPTAHVDDYFYICSSVPTPDSYTTIYTPNTATLSCEYTITYGVKADSCNARIYEYGRMAYWESLERYPCNAEVWGDLADTPIRHHKFPDCKISPYFKNNKTPHTPGKYLYEVQDNIYPIGVRIDVEQIKTLLLEAESQKLITTEERLSICGYRILRGNRRGNESIIAKGVLYDVWKYKENIYNSGDDVLYPNYPYNPQTPDIFNRASKIATVSDIHDDDGNLIFNPILHPYSTSHYVNNKYTFHSPNTHFNNPSLGNELKLELELYGSSEGKFTQATNHATYQYTGVGMFQAAWGLACAESFVETVQLVAQATSSYAVLGTFVSTNYILAIVSVNIGAPGIIFGHYYEWLDLLQKFAPYRNYAWYYTSVGRYTDWNTTNIIPSNIRRGLGDAQYLTQGIRSVKDGFSNKKINNFKRESSVYLNLNQIGVDSSIDSTFLAPSIIDDSRWYPGDGTISCDNLGYNYNTICSYYASIKNNLPSQYGQVDQIEYIDTGYNGVIDWNNTQNTDCSPIFGGDTFIGREYLRTQFPFYLQDRIGYSPNSDVTYSQLGNVGFPQFFMNYPTSTDSDSSSSALYGNIAVQGTKTVDYNFACPDYTGEGLYQAGVVTGILSAIAAGTSLSIGLGITYGVVKTILENNTDGHAVFLKGKHFLYSYGTPGYIVESDYNLDLRYGTNQKQGNFYPYVGDLVTWTQPTSDFNLINYDNIYSYNRDYSKQNKENLGYTLNPNFSQTKEDCKVNHPNRVIYSLQDNDNNDRFDGNLVFLANNYYDFPKSGGKLSIIKGEDNNRVLVIQEDQASIFNSYISTQNETIAQSTVGSNQLFNRSIPSQYVQTDLGFGGSQTSAIVSTEFGTYWVDNKRGQVLELNPNPKIGFNDIVSEEDSWWFKEFLPFKILNYFPTVDIRNNYKYFGMCLVWDSRYKRVLISKRDAKPHSQYINKITFDGSNFHITEDNKDLIIFPTNPKYFCNQSFTISYSPILKQFISFHSYTPNYYISHQNYYSGGYNYSPIQDDTDLGLWGFNLTNRSFQVFQGKKSPFILEYAVNSIGQNKILDAIKYNTEIRRYQDDLTYSINNSITYSNVLIYNAQQSTGTLTLISKLKNNVSQFIKYSNGYVENNATSILVENVENFYNINNFKDIALSNGQSLMSYECGHPYKTINPLSISYKPNYFTNKLRNSTFLVRFENNQYTNFNFLHLLSIAEETNSTT